MCSFPLYTIANFWGISSEDIRPWLRLRGGVKLWAKGYDPPVPWPGLLFRVGSRHGLSGISPRVGDSRQYPVTQS